jgi:uncharacterized protein (DUF2267 family)
MANTGFHIFDKTVQKTNQILTDIEEDLNWQDRREQTYSALRFTLHALRDRLQVNASANFASQLPMLIKGIYFDGWDPANVPQKMDKEEFLSSIQENFNYSVESLEEVVKVVLNNLLKHMDEGIAKDVKDSLPSDIATLLK